MLVYGTGFWSMNVVVVDTVANGRTDGYRCANSGVDKCTGSTSWHCAFDGSRSSKRDWTCFGLCCTLPIRWVWLVVVVIGWRWKESIQIKSTDRQIKNKCHMRGAYVTCTDGTASRLDQTGNR